METGMYLQMDANVSHFVNETTFTKFPEFRRIQNEDGSFSLKAKKSDQLVMFKNCSKFTFHQHKGLRTACESTSMAFYLNHQRNVAVTAPRTLNNYSFFASPAQLRFYVVKKELGVERAPASLYFLLAEDSILPESDGSFRHYRPFKVTGGKELHKAIAFEQLLEVHNLELDDGGRVVLRDKVNNQRFCDVTIDYHYWNNTKDVRGNSNMQIKNLKFSHFYYPGEEKSQDQLDFLAFNGIFFEQIFFWLKKGLLLGITIELKAWKI